MTQKLEDYVRGKATEFVALLDGRYRAHVSDQFIVAYLVMEFRLRNFGGGKASITNVAYQAAMPLFEMLLEYGCRAGGNGHHVAQDFSALFLPETTILSRENEL